MLVPEMVGQIKRFLVDNEIRFMAVAPSSLKKIGMGKGNAKDAEVKNHVANYLKDNNISCLFENPEQKMTVHMADSVLFALVGYNFLCGNYSEDIMKKLNDCIVGKNEDSICGTEKEYGKSYFKGF